MRCLIKGDRIRLGKRCERIRNQSMIKAGNDNVAFCKDNSSCIRGFAILIIMICHFAGTFGNGIRVFTPL